MYDQTQLREVTRIVRGAKTMEGAGVRLRRTIGMPQLDQLDPFLLLDEFRSDDPGDYQAGFPTHPHRGIETVTYMIAGEMRHQDSLGNSRVIGPGDVQWMTAGGGIIHSEMPAQREGLLWGYQLWVNLPSGRKLCPPRYQDLSAERIPMIKRRDGALIRIIAGEVNGVRGAVEGISVDPLYLDVDLPPFTRFSLPLPTEHTAFAHIVAGSVSFGGRSGETVTEGELAVFGKGQILEARTETRSGRLLLIAGSPINEPVARYGPFVMNSMEEIAQAFQDYRTGQLESVESPECH